MVEGSKQNVRKCLRYYPKMKKCAAEAAHEKRMLQAATQLFPPLVGCKKEAMHFYREVKCTLLIVGERLYALFVASQDHYTKSESKKQEMISITG